MKKSILILLSILSIVAFVAIAQSDKVVQIFRNGKVIQEYAVSDIDYIEVNNKVENPDTGIINGHEYVDLGLPSGLKWATCNVGASSPTESGDFFAWGETKPKSTYTKLNSVTYTKDQSDFSGNPEFDVATATWGDLWRMPTRTEYLELRAKCTWDWTTKNGVNGYIVTGPNGNSIFFPAAGYRDGSSHYSAGVHGIYWSSTPNDSQYARELSFLRSYLNADSSNSRYYGRTVRAVSGSLAPTTPVTSMNIIASVSDGVVTVIWSEVEGATYNLYRSADDNEYILLAEGLTEPRYSDQNPLEGDNYYKVKANTENIMSEYSSATHVVIVPTLGIINGHEYVDLGLPSGLKWATSNVGANSPEEFGDYFAWGETQPKPTYSESNNKTSGINIANISGNPEYDAASANWGSLWRMPTIEEMQELIDNCIWEWTTKNGIRGYLVTGPNGNQIFLPAAGYRYDNKRSDIGMRGYYWRSSAISVDYSFSLEFDINTKTIYNGGHRYAGRSIRAVSSAISPNHKSINLRWVDQYNMEVSKVKITLNSESYVLPNISKDAEVEVSVTSSNPEVAEWENSKIVIKSPGRTVFNATSYETKDYATEETSFTLIVESKNEGTISGLINGYEYVDLGLPSGLKWATCNIGADTPEEYGDYIAWGETAPKLEYTQENCLTWDKDFSDISGNPEYDVATANWGGTWRMPTKDEMEELYKKCTWEWITQNGTNGYLVTGPNGNQIFLPSAGYQKGSLKFYTNLYGYYLSSSPYPIKYDAYGFLLYNRDNHIYGIYRDLGQSVRAVSE